MNAFDSPTIKHVHLIGICGTGMGSLAGMLKAKGFHVTGSDENVYPPMSEQLAALEIPVMSGYRPDNLNPAPDLVVIGNVVSKGNPEGDAVVARGIPYLSMADTLKRFFFTEKTTIALCGTHGKTTSTALLAWLSTEAKLDPTYLVGGVMKNTGSSYHVGLGNLAVVEGDEYDTAWFDKVPKFIRYRPDIAAVGNIEFDHADIYPDLTAVIDAFRQLIIALPPDGLLIAGTDSENVRNIISQASCRVVTYALDRPADWTARLIELNEEHMSFELFACGQSRGIYQSRLVGRFNLLNILGVMIIADHLGIEDRFVKQALISFQSVKRRQQILGEGNGILIVDDFAHHPTAVKVTLESLKAIRPERRLVTVFEPRTNTSRRRFFQQQYAEAFDAADLTIICEVPAKHGAIPEDKLNVRQLIEEIGKRGGRSIYAGNYDEVMKLLGNELRSGDQLVFLSNGGFGNLPRKSLQAFATESK